MLRSHLIVAFVAVALSATVAQAQIPNIRRKAKDAGQRAVTGQPTQQKPPPKFDNTIIELNPQVVARLITGLDARSSSRGAGGLTAAQMRQRSSAAAEEATSLNNQHSDDRAKWTDANSNAENCVSDELSKAEQRHSEAMQRRMMGMTGPVTADNQKFMQDYGAAATELQQASLANDTAAIRRATEKMNKVMGVDPRADSAQARATCRVPPVPAWMRRADSLSALSDTLLVRARAAEDAGNAAAARAAEMTPAQFAMAAERAEGFVRLKDAGNVGSGYVFTPAEEQALNARISDLKKHFG